MKRRHQALLWVVVLVAALVFVWLRPGGEGDRPDSAGVEREDFRVVVEATGKLEAAVAYEIGPPSVQDTWSYNLTWMIPEGSRVQQGAVVARFDATAIEDRLRDHRATLETTIQEREKEERNLEVSLRQLRLDLVKAESALKTVDLQLAGPEELLPPLEREQLRLQRDLARRRHEFLAEKIEFEQELVKSKLELLDVKRAFAEGKIAYNEALKSAHAVKAPVSGLVVYIPKRNGDRYERGESVFMMAKIMQVADVATLRVEASVLEIDAARIAVGQPAEVSVDAVPGLTFGSRIEEAGRMVRGRSLQDRSKVFDVILPLEDVDTEVLRPGMGVTVSIEAERLPGRLTVPVSAVHRSPEGFYVEMAAGRERRPVVLGPRNRERVVVEEGLEEGERVLLSAGRRAA